MTKYFGMELWFGVLNISAGLFGIPVGFLVIWLVSLFTKEPSAEMQQFVQSLRIPKGGTMMDEKEASA